MKKILLLGLLLLLAVNTYAASEKLPKGAYMWSDFETAKAESIKNKKPLLFMQTNLKSTWGPCIRAGLSLMALGKKEMTVVVIQCADLSSVPQKYKDDLYNI